VYTPAFNQVSNRAVLIEAMRTYSFAILFGPGHDLRATHLPLLVSEEGEHGTLLGHFARANNHWSALAGRETLVVFPGPHSYVSPSFYSEPLSVPTWNYITIHAYGTLSVIEDPDAKNNLVEQLIEKHEPPYLDRWRTMPEGFRRTMLAGIMGFRIPISRIEGKFKLSQNRAPEERRNVQSAHAAGADDQRELARWMEKVGIVAPQERRSVQAAQTAATDDQHELARWTEKLGIVAPDAQRILAPRFSVGSDEVDKDQKSRRDAALSSPETAIPRKQES
jgi:transcriptional regulator